MPETPLNSEDVIFKLRQMLSLAQGQLRAVRAGDAEGFESLTMQRESLQREIDAALKLHSGHRFQADPAARILLVQINQIDRVCIAEAEKLTADTRKALKDAQAHLDWSRWHRAVRPSLVDTMK
ncbi:MAG TPA: hypothetical protein GXX40_06465 [Firmicutes bacterium]|nr:hypothetical protein [Bacillota bacterium]